MIKLDKSNSPYKLKECCSTDENDYGMMFIVIAMIIFLVVFSCASYYKIIGSVTINKDEAICTEKSISGGSMTFKFVRKCDSKDLSYTIYETDSNGNTFNELKNRIKKGNICVIETNKFDEIRNVNVPVDD